MNKSFILFLKNFGLTEKQAKIYLACLELGESSIAEIAKKAQIKRTTIYNIIEEMLEKGFLSKFGEKRKENYVAEPPDKLLNILKNREIELRGWLPKLLAITNAGSTFKPEVRFYQGKEGLKAVYDDTIKYSQKGTEILTYVSVADCYNIIPNYIKSYLKRRIESRITMRAIGNDSTFIRKHRSRTKKN